MSDRSSANSEYETGEAMVGLKADAKTIALLTSSSQAVKGKRDENKLESAMSSLGDALQVHFADSAPETAGLEEPGKGEEAEQAKPDSVAQAEQGASEEKGTGSGKSE
jgi:hypothetical protein